MLFLISLCCIINTTQAQYTAIPDANFEAYLEANGMGDGIDNNNLVLTANINTVTLLNVNNQDIEDLTGIEDFTALEVLACSYNPVTSLDLSQNLALIELYAGYNNYLTSLDVTQNTELDILACIENSLSSLDLSQNNKLTEVYCYSNFITSLEINSPFLYWLDCSFNNLTSLEVSSPELFWFHCYQNQLTSLDVSQNLALEYFLCHENNLTNIDVSQNTILKSFSCAYNNITTIDITQNTQLDYFTCLYNNIESIDLTQNSLLTQLGASNNPSLSYLDMRNGANETMGLFIVQDTALDCIFVDDASAEYLDDWHIDPNTTFVNNEQECEDLSVAGFEQDTFTVYPNPAQNILNVNITTRANYTLFTTQGKIVNTGVLHEGTNTLSLLNLSSGLYFLKVYAKDGVTTKKVIKW